MRIAALGSVGMGAQVINTNLPSRVRRSMPSRRRFQQRNFARPFGAYQPSMPTLQRHVVEHRAIKSRGMGALEPMSYSQIFAWASVVTGVGLIFWMVAR